MRHLSLALVLVASLLTGTGTAYAVEPAATSAKVKHAPAAMATAPKAKVNINTAGPEELADVLVGVGKSKAEAIVAYRQQHGAFKAAEELAQVKGISNGTVEKNRDRILLN